MARRRGRLGKLPVVERGAVRKRGVAIGAMDGAMKEEQGLEMPFACCSVLYRQR